MQDVLGQTEAPIRDIGVEPVADIVRVYTTLLFKLPFSDSDQPIHHYGNRDVG